MRRVLLFTDTPLFGGAENQMLLLARYLDRKKYEPVFATLTSKHLDPLHRRLKKANIVFQVLPFVNKNDPRIAVALVDLIRSQKIELMHLHLWNPASCRFGFVAANKMQMPTVVTEHDPFKLNIFKQIIKKWLTRNVKAITAISKHNAALLRLEYGEMPVHLIPNGIDSEEFSAKLSPIERINTRARDFEASEDDTVILSVGTLHERKGHDVLLHAFANVFKNSSKPFLILVGSGPEEHALKTLAEELHIKNRVRFLGQRDDISHLMGAADIFVYPSKREALGMALLEAGTMRLPVIASNVGGIPDIISDEDTGLLVEPGSLYELETALSRLIHDEVFMKRLGENLYAKVNSEFSAEHMARLTEKVYDDALS